MSFAVFIVVWGSVIAFGAGFDWERRRQWRFALREAEQLRDDARVLVDYGHWARVGVTAEVATANLRRAAAALPSATGIERHKNRFDQVIPTTSNPTGEP